MENIDNLIKRFEGKRISADTLSFVACHLNQLKYFVSLIFPNFLVQKVVAGLQVHCLSSADLIVCENGVLLLGEKPNNIFITINVTINRESPALSWQTW